MYVDYVAWFGMICGLCGLFPGIPAIVLFHAQESWDICNDKMANHFGDAAC